jgi:N-acetylmuramoyl-L-alanine amidase
MLNLIQLVLDFISRLVLGGKPKGGDHQNEIDPHTNVSEPTIIWHPSPMYNTRDSRKITCIVLHHTASFKTASDVDWLCNPQAKASAHYVIGLIGEIYQLVRDIDIAWHAGDSIFKGVRFVNQYSIGIELTGDTNTTALTDPQYKSLIWLVKKLMKEYSITIDNITDHRSIALPVGRKTDLGIYFDWSKFYTDVQV